MSVLTFAQMQAVSLERVYREFQVPSPHPTIIPGPVTVRLRNMWAGEYFDLMDSTVGNDEEAQWRSDHFGELMAAFCWVNEEGCRCMSDEDLQTDAWRKTSPAFQAALLAKVREVCGEIQQVGDGVEDELKNSETASGENSA